MANGASQLIFQHWDNSGCIPAPVNQSSSRFYTKPLKSKQHIRSMTDNSDLASGPDSVLSPLTSFVLFPVSGDEIPVTTTRGPWSHSGPLHFSHPPCATAHPSLCILLPEYLSDSLNYKKLRIFETVCQQLGIQKLNKMWFFSFSSRETSLGSHLI